MRSKRNNPPDNTDRPGLANRVWRSIFRKPIVPRDDSDRKWVMVNALVFHFRPMRLAKTTAKYTHTWGLGGMSAVLFFLLASTGVLLMFVYEPSPGLAYDSIVSLENDVFFGQLIRNIHHWSANFLIVVVLLHLLRVYLTGAYYAPRQFNWVLGLLLLLCVLTSNFTGYLLPWDQLSYWATTIVTGMLEYVPFAGSWLQGVIRGGPDVSSATLIYFYAAHTTVVPVLIIVLMAFHFWRVRKARGVVVPRSPDVEPEENPEKVLTMPHLLLREFAVGLILIAFVMVFALLFDAPLGEAANPGMSPNPAKAPWYFLGFQELLLHFHPLFAVVLFPLLAAIGLLLIPYVRYDRDTSGVFLMSHAGRRLALVAALTALLLTPLLIVVDEFWIDLGTWLSVVPAAISIGLLPAGFLLVSLAGVYAYARKRHAAANNEAVQTLFVLLAVALVILTVTGVWFRGEGMALVWPWNM
jgi:quinol-cytochrome oxidoreductase complex cytochrome b subunit